MIALLFYRILFLLLLPLLLVVFIIRSKNHPQYRQRLLERLGFPAKQGTSKKHGIIVHAASVGEVIALKSFIEQLIIRYTDLPITVTTFTPTGSEQVKKIFKERVQHCYLPLDIYPCTLLFLQRFQPKIIIFMETELWPNLINQCANKQIKLLLINARLSNKSMRSYKKLSALITPTLNKFNRILCQSQDNYQHYIELGANKNHCQVSGNLKFDISVNADIETKKQELTALIATPSKHNKPRPLWVIASSHEGDEQLVLQAFQQILKSFPNLLLVIVPRHPERFEQVANICIEQGYSLAKRSEKTIISDQQIWLLDSLGELMAMYALADIVTMGGSFSDIGGHNPLEPALFKKPIVVGSDMKNFTEVLAQLQQENAIVQLDVIKRESTNKKDKTSQQQAEQLSQAVLSLLQTPQQQRLLGDNAYKVVLANQGASLKTLAEVEKLLS